MTGKKKYTQVGKALFRTRPDLANELLRQLSEGEETSLDKIFIYYGRLGEWLNDNPGQRQVDVRRMFVTAMLKLYSPCIFSSTISKSNYGLFKNIAGCFNVSQQAVWRDAKNSIVTYNVYEDFKNKVDELISFFKEN